MHIHLGVAEYTNSRYKVAIRAMGKALESTFYTVIQLRPLLLQVWD